VQDKHFAIIYDFDETLTANSSLDYTIFPLFNIKPAEFWRTVDKETFKNNADWVLVFMRLVLKMAYEKGIKITEKTFHQLAPKIVFAKGIPAYFNNINRFYNKNFKAGSLSHYIVSGNLRELVKSSVVAKYMDAVFGSGYHYENGIATFPAISVNELSKTHFIYMINNGKAGQNKRKTDFKNMIYIGDGITDVPSMVTVKSNGGNSIAVYNSKKDFKTCKELMKAGSVNYIAAADYSETSGLVKIIKKIIKGRCLDS